MNWDFVEQMAKIQADRYASSGGQHAPGSSLYNVRYSGFLAGYIQNAGERESLRTMLRRLDAKNGIKDEALPWEQDNGAPIMMIADHGSTTPPSLETLI